MFKKNWTSHLVILPCFSLPLAFLVHAVASGKQTGIHFQLFLADQLVISEDKGLQRGG